jgi:hypothetical protein
MTQKLIVMFFGLLVGGALFYTPPQLDGGRFLPFVQSERLLIWFICMALVACWTTLSTKITQRSIYASILCSVMTCIGYQAVVSVYRFRVGMTFDHLVSWDRFIPAACVSMLGAVALGFILGKATLKFKKAY